MFQIAWTFNMFIHVLYYAGWVIAHTFCSPQKAVNFCYKPSGPFFLKCSKVTDFWNMILNWLEHLNEINLKNIFGYPNPSPKQKTK